MSKFKKKKRIINTHEQIINKLFEYLDFLQTPNPTFNNMPICPFIQGDLQTGNIKFMVYNSNMDTSLIEMIQEWEQSDFKTGLILHVGDDMKTTKRKPYQKFLNEQLRENKMGDVKILCFSPFEDWTVAGEKTREKSPYFLINLAETDALDEAHRSLWKTKYFDNFSKSEIKTLKVYPKNKKVINENNKSKSPIRK